MDAAQAQGISVAWTRFLVLMSLPAAATVSPVSHQRPDGRRRSADRQYPCCCKVVRRRGSSAGTRLGGGRGGVVGSRLVAAALHPDDRRQHPAGAQCVRLLFDDRGRFILDLAVLAGALSRSSRAAERARFAVSTATGLATGPAARQGRRLPHAASLCPGRRRCGPATAYKRPSFLRPHGEDLRYALAGLFLFRARHQSSPSSSSATRCSKVVL